MKAVLRLGYSIHLETKVHEHSLLDRAGQAVDVYLAVGVHHGAMLAWGDQARHPGLLFIVLPIVGHGGWARRLAWLLHLKCKFDSYNSARYNGWLVC